MLHHILKRCLVGIVLLTTACTRSPFAARPVTWHERRDGAVVIAQQQQPDIGVTMIWIPSFSLAHQPPSIPVHFSFLQPDDTSVCVVSPGTGQVLERVSSCVTTRMTPEERAYSREQLRRATISPEAAIQQAMAQAQAFIATHQAKLEIGGILQIPSPDWLAQHPTDARRVFWRIHFFAPNAEKQVSIDAITGQMFDSQEANHS